MNERVAKFCVGAAAESGETRSKWLVGILRVILVAAWGVGTMPGVARAAVNYLNVALNYSGGNYSMTLQLSATKTGTLHIFGTNTPEIDPSWSQNNGNYVGCYNSLSLIFSIAGVPSTVYVSDAATLTSTQLTLGGASVNLASNSPATYLPTLMLPDGYAIGGTNNLACNWGSHGIYAGRIGDNGPLTVVTNGSGCGLAVSGYMAPAYAVFSTASGFCVGVPYSGGTCQYAGVKLQCTLAPTHVIGY